VLDVRRKPEWEAGISRERPGLLLTTLKARCQRLIAKRRLHHLQERLSQPDCQQFLQRAGFENVTNVSGGLSAWEKAKLSVVTESPVTVRDKWAFCS